VINLLATFHVERMVDMIERPVIAPSIEIATDLLFGGKSLGIAFHW
jgi:hypothetical protein